MKRLNAVSIAAGVSTLALGLMLAPSASADGPNDHGCYDQSIRCSNWILGSGTCGYNASANACTCANGGSEWQTYDCQS